MSSSIKWVIGIIVLIIIVIAAVMLIGSKPAVAPSSSQNVATGEMPGMASSSGQMPQSSSTPATGGSGNTAQTPVTVTLSDTGLSPANLTIKVGQSVTFVNQSSGQMWVAVNPHPVHTGYDGTSRSQHCAPGYNGPAPFDECTPAGPGASWTFTFNKKGTWSYHNHAAAEIQGTVTVQ